MGLVKIMGSGGGIGKIKNGRYVGKYYATPPVVAPAFVKFKSSNAGFNSIGNNIDIPYIAGSSGSHYSIPVTDGQLLIVQQLTQADNITIRAFTATFTDSAVTFSDPVVIATGQNIILQSANIALLALPRYNDNNKKVFGLFYVKNITGCPLIAHYIHVLVDGSVIVFEENTLGTGADVIGNHNINICESGNSGRYVILSGASGNFGAAPYISLIEPTGAAFMVHQNEQTSFIGNIPRDIIFLENNKFLAVQERIYNESGAQYTTDFFVININDVPAASITKLNYTGLPVANGNKIKLIDLQNNNKFAVIYSGRSAGNNRASMVQYNETTGINGLYNLQISTTYPAEFLLDYYARFDTSIIIAQSYNYYNLLAKTDNTINLLTQPVAGTPSINTGNYYKKTIINSKTEAEYAIFRIGFKMSRVRVTQTDYVEPATVNDSGIGLLLQTADLSRAGKVWATN